MSQGAEVPTDHLGAFVIGPRLLESGAPGGPLSGLRFGVKDLFDVAGTRTGAGNPDWLADAPVASTHAPAVSALLAAGADLWGKTVTDELAYSLSGTNVHYGTPVNTAAPGHVPGGSSSGSAAAVAGGEVELALGTDTGGSIRVPASYCGIYGLRSTHGRVSLSGVVPLAPSFDTVGLFAADPAQLAAAWQSLAAGAPGPEQPRAVVRRAIRRLVVATDLMDLAEDRASGALRVAAATLGERLGLSIVEMPLAGAGQLESWRECFRVLQQVEAWRSDGDWITSREPSLGPGVAARFARARSTDPADARRALNVRTDVIRAFERVTGEDGVVVQPTTSGPAPLLVTGQPNKAANGDQPADEDRLAGHEAAAKEDVRVRTLTLTAPAGMAGAPVVSLPLSSVDGLPVGLALVGRPGDDETLVALAEGEALS
ncbi:MAG: amidase [Acidimicrobiales bacterium]